MKGLNEFQRWCKDLVPIAQACAEGKEVERQDIDGKWYKKHATCGFEFGRRYRIKPRTITVNGFEVPEPMREAPVVGVEYYLVDVSNDRMAAAYLWRNHTADKCWLSRGICHYTKEAAIAHAKAMLGIDPNGDSK